LLLWVNYFAVDLKLIADSPINIRQYVFSGPVSVVGIATGYGLDGPGVESRWGRDLPHLSSPGAHPAFCTMGTGSFPGVKSGRGVTLTLHLLVPWSRRVELYIYSPYGPYGLYRASVPIQGCTLTFLIRLQTADGKTAHS
jgi:hypothetical protein